MKKILKLLIFLCLLGLLWYKFGNTFLVRFFPCQNPIVYNIGTFDAKFGISKSYFLSALSEAEMIWEKPFGKELFTYKENDTNETSLKINLVYDYRQQATSKLASLGIEVEDNQNSYDTLKAKYKTLQTQYLREKKDYQAEEQSFSAEKKVYEDQVQYWNARGGAPKEEYERLQTEKLILDGQLFQLQTLQKKVNDIVDEINALVVVLNRLAGTLNIYVEKYNTINVARGESFEEGVYKNDGVNKEIDIYEFSSRAKLVRVLAHELGHALDLDHVDDPKAIMYKLNQGKNQALTEADLEALNTKCEVASP